MEDKTYTAQEMRNFADAIAVDLNESGHTSVQYSYHDLIPVIESLRCAADLMEREEKREKKYEYGVRFNENKIDRDYIFESKKYARTVAGDSLQVFRREVGEWEEVK